MNLSTLLSTDPYNCGFAPYISQIGGANLAMLTSMVNQRGLGGQTINIPAVVSPLSLLSNVSQDHLALIEASGQSDQLDQAMLTNNIPVLLNLLQGFVGAGWLSSTEQTAIQTYLTGLSTATQSVPATPAEAAGIVPYGGSVARRDVENAL